MARSKKNGSESNIKAGADNPSADDRINTRTEDQPARTSTERARPTNDKDGQIGEEHGRNETPREDVHDTTKSSTAATDPKDGARQPEPQVGSKQKRVKKQLIHCEVCDFGLYGIAGLEYQCLNCYTRGIFL